MTWSINWDSSQNNNSFAKENGAFLAALRNNQEETKQPETTTEEPTTKAPETTEQPTTKAPETTTEKPTTKAPETTTQKPSQYPAWDASTIYVRNDYVSYNGHVYRAKWWTKGENPEKSGQWDVWQKIK